jgi:hypothetical protein
MRLLLALPSIIAALLLAACGSPIVGAECRDGFTNCDGECVDLSSDPDHCGSCEDGCGAFTCEDSECTEEPRPDGGDGDGDGGGDGDGDGDGGTSGRDGGITPIGTGNPFLPDSGIMFPDPGVGNGCPIGTVRCGERCVDFDTDVNACGGCGMQCADDQFCSMGMCVDFCEAPLELCLGGCVDYQTNPFHCGSCGNVCASGICAEARCADAVIGHVVVIGHDYRARGFIATQRLAYNALDRAQGAPIKALMFEGEASGVLINGLRNAINSGVASQGRTWQETTVIPEELTSQLFRANILLIPAQNNATNEQLLELGVEWGRALTQFVARGGVIALFDGPSPMNTGTHQLLGPSGLFVAEGRRTISSGQLTVVDRTNVIAEGVGRTYQVTRDTVSFTDVATPGTVVVEAPNGDPVVIHQVIQP